MSELSEKVGAAVYEKLRTQFPDLEHRWSGSVETMIGRAAIEAMREPTEAMIQAVWDETGDPSWRDNAADAWKAGIDAALK